MDVTQKIITQILTKCEKNGYNDYSTSLIHFIVQSIIISTYSGGGGGGGGNEHNSTNPVHDDSTSTTSNTAALSSQFSLLQADGSMNNSATLTPAQILNLIDQACQLLCQSNSPKLATVLMQNALLDLRQQIQLSQDDYLKTHLFKSEKLIDEIIKKKEEAEVFGDIVLFILHETRLLNDSTERIEKETMTALESVIPRNFIHSFITQDEEEKKNQLYDLWKIVWGIRLFNKASDKGGAGIHRLTIHDPQSFPPLMQQLEQHMDELAPLVDKYATVLQHVSSGKSSNADPDRLRQEYTNKRQIMAFLKQIHKQLNQMGQQSNDIQDAMLQTIDNVHQIVNQRTSVPKSTIYPLFINLAESWLSTDSIQNQFTQLEAMINELQKHSENTFDATDLDALAEESSENEHESEDPLSGESIESQSARGSQSAQRVQPDASVQPDLGGFDPIKLVSGAKLLRDGDPNVDYVHYMNRYYAFETEESVNKFLANPQRYLELVMETVTQESDLIHLLNLEERLPKSVHLPGDQNRKTKQMINVCLQTEVHPLDGYIDPKYEWSEWKLRKLALKFASLRNKRTHSTQTQYSHFRRDGESQVDSKAGQPLGARTKDQQTAKEKGTAPVQHFTYIKGLRSVGDKAENVTMHFDPMDKQQ
uniref:Cilia- and flagella-associated protein 206 n=1 Tax=Percolomonas cosmopolitus TaxID=63605 RepID=A0A7S1PFX1_9EUKA|mmetsp:Transcript_1714/g.5989  ORF Transcript_1714/g.5989 Transcript_1714/m.5989 type:complete len:648 (+) Transcript_1714:2186-4129(+)